MSAAHSGMEKAISAAWPEAISLTPKALRMCQPTTLKSDAASSSCQCPEGTTIRWPERRAIVSRIMPLTGTHQGMEGPRLEGFDGNLHDRPIDPPQQSDGDQQEES